MRSFINIVESSLVDVGFYHDNPAVKWGESGEQWIRDKQDFANYMASRTSRRTGIGARLLSGNATANLGLHKPFYLPSAEIHALPGCNDEDRKPSDLQYDTLAARVAKDGFDLSHRNAVLIGVNHRGEAFVIEGNTRAAVACEMGIPVIPVEIKWFNGAEMINGNWNPENVVARGQSHP